MDSNQTAEIQTLCTIQSTLSKAGLDRKINLPNVIVLGAQSSGKSSVLEHIIGREFLPRGQGIVTRRPVIIQKIVDPNISRDQLSVNDTPVSSYEKLGQMLSESMQQAARSGDGITAEPVIVRMVLNSGVSLSLIDMPGLTKIALKDQSPEFPKLIENICRSYIQNPNSILLAVSPANVDVANSDALHLARQVDRTGDRTIGVFTKMDLIEDPNTIRKAFEGRAYTLKLGYFGVICRSKKDMSSGVTLKQALSKESSFFSKDSYFREFSSNLGIRNLSQRLSFHLLQKIRETLPFVKTSVSNMITQKQAYAKNFQKISDLYNTGSHHALIVSLVSMFTSSFQGVFQGGTLKNMKGSVST
jgi:dynamin 1-like protein